MLFDLINNRGTIKFVDLIFMFIAYAIIILVALPVHEFSHGFVAYKLGDNTAKWNGRLTLNPFAHLDIFGTLMIFLFGVGYAKPVPVNPRNFRNYKSGMALTALAGPVSNFLMGFLSLAILRVFYPFLSNNLTSEIIWTFLYTFANININLGIFNLLPIPPLDGFRIIANVLPGKWSYFVDQYQMYITLGVLLLLFTGFLNTPIAFLTNGVYHFFTFILGF